MTEARDAHAAALLASGDFDAAWYVEQFPDVALLRMDAFEHYSWIGKRLGRSPSRSAAVQHHALNTQPEHDLGAGMDLLFVDGANGTTSTTYRVDHVARGLGGAGWKVNVVRGDHLASLQHQRVAAARVVFFRSPFWSPYREFAERMRAQGATIIYDIDDLVFDEDIMPYMDGNRFLSQADVEQYRRGIRAYRDFVEYSDFCTLSTNALADEVRRLGKAAFRVRNTINAKNIAAFAPLPARGPARPSPFVVGYYSGTKTHQADFSMVADALVAFMSERDDVHFRLVGQFELAEFPQLAPFESRIIRVGLMPHDTMLRDQLSCDVIIAPLELNNPFCEAKSELKFFEAALAKVPVIASPTRTFVEATENGRFAKLAATTADWRAAFTEVYADYGAAVQRAEAAHDYVCREYAEGVAARECMAACQSVAPPSATRSSIQAAKERGVADVAVLITDVVIGGGGHRKVFKICHDLERAGLSVAIYVVYSERPERDIRDEIKAYFYDIDAEVVHFRGALREHRFVICTHWATAYELRKTPFQGRAFYFVQDFEPLFNAAGSDYIRALSTYTSGPAIVCYGRWVAAKLRSELGVSCASVPFTLDHRTYAPPSEDVDRDVDVLFFARPSQERRCFPLIIEGLRELKRLAPHFSIGLFGEDEYPDLGFDYVNHGLITDQRRLADLYRRTKVGICFSTTNPSQLGYEMIACGAALVDVAVKFHELNFDGDSFVKYCVGTPEGISESCLALLNNRADLERRRRLGYEFVARMPADEDLGREFLKASGLDLIAMSSDGARQC